MQCSVTSERIADAWLRPATCFLNIATMPRHHVQRVRSETYAAYRLAIPGRSGILPISELGLNPHTAEKIKAATLNRRTFLSFGSGFFVFMYNGIPSYNTCQEPRSSGDGQSERIADALASSSAALSEFHDSLANEL